MKKKKDPSYQRSVSTDALQTLGMIIGEDSKRDAIHLAVIPAKAGETLKAGQYITYRDGIARLDDNGLGIVDPFVKGEIKDGQCFWMVLKPRIITSLRHVWSHPDFPNEIGTEINPELISSKAKMYSELWLRNYCDKNDVPNYDIVMKACLGRWDKEDGYASGENRGDYVFFKNIDAHAIIPPEFWNHFEVVTGKKIANKPTMFTCSC